MEPKSEEKKQLRTGWTTGACSAAAAKAAAFCLTHQKNIKDIEITIPMGKQVKFDLKRCEFNKNEATCSVIKDAGDDPDCTNGAELTATVLWINQKRAIILDRGPGVAMITKAGLGLEVNGPAINPVPKKNITEMVKEAAEPFLNEQGLKIIISVPRGEEMAKETQNERLGILGGISILGTTGIVVPFSTAAYKASIAQGIDIVIAAGHDTLVLTTGGRSEIYAMKILDFPNECYVQMGDFVGFSTKQAALKGIKKIILCGMPGKMSKIAAGKMQTHVAGSQVDMTFLAEMAKEVGASESVIEEILKANTARHVHEILTLHGILELWNEVARRVCEVCHKNAGGKVILESILTDFDGQILGRYEKRTN